MTVRPVTGKPKVPVAMPAASEAVVEFGPDGAPGCCSTTQVSAMPETGRPSWSSTRTWKSCWSPSTRASGLGVTACNEETRDWGGGGGAVEIASIRNRTVFEPRSATAEISIVPAAVAVKVAVASPCELVVELVEFGVTRPVPRVAVQAIPVPPIGCPGAPSRRTRSVKVG